MTATPDFQELTRQIQQVVQAHIVASHRAAATALEQAFSSTGGPGPRVPRTPRPGKASRRRPPAEIAALGERLFKAVCARPGETMSVLAGDVGMTPRELHRPMTHLKRNGRVRSVGQRHLARYFPMVSQANDHV